LAIVHTFCLRGDVKINKAELEGEQVRLVSFYRWNFTQKINPETRIDKKDLIKFCSDQLNFNIVF
jgi:hypothetical protein